MIALAALALLLQAATPVDTVAAPPVQMGVLVQPETVTVGQHFSMRLRVRARKGAEIGFPVGPDSGAAVEAVDPMREQPSKDTTATERTATYRLVAWSIGAHPIVLGALVVSAAGVDRRYAVPSATIVVRSVRPEDSTGKVPRDARSVLFAPRALWPFIAGALAILLLLIWMLRRRVRRGPRAPRPGSGAIARARRDFARIESLALLDAGERGRFVALHVDVLRDYLAARIPEAGRSLSTTELVTALGASAPVPMPRLTPILAAADQIKYGDRTVDADRAREIAAESRTIVEAVEEAVLHREQQAPKPERAA